MNQINIVHLYPKEMNIYGDNGNVLVLQKRLIWRGISTNVIRVGINEHLPTNTHLIIGGGGQDAGQTLIAKDLQSKSKTLKQMATDGIPMLMICGMYQMFGHYFKTYDDTEIPGIGLLDLYTIAGKGRLIGNIASKSKWGRLVGYENHSGLTYLGNNVNALGVSKRGQGNNGDDETEGAYQNNVFGSYLHGPILAKSPLFADHLLSLALIRAGLANELTPLDDNIENMAANIAVSRRR